MRKLQLTTAERELIESIDKTDKQLDKPFLQALGLSTSFRNEEAADVLMNQMDPIVQGMLGDLSTLIDIQKKSSDEAARSAIVTGDRLATTVYVVEGVVLMLAVHARLVDHPQHHGADFRFGRGGAARGLRRPHLAHRVERPATRLRSCSRPCAT